ncbi:hypothetical protein CALCODRAFT_555909 [Calocera cornea HHB12733]|uniref:Uncharacterized protein n=1 Tax=Calocera cornea HHB12733 TaxID=1353952 RepID=A0A165FAZ8_9BASI|nr:hypothetical protein CALCODRAFT_555909 [Calocera cornea HHB12733]
MFLHTALAINFLLFISVVFAAPFTLNINTQRDLSEWSGDILPRGAQREGTVFEARYVDMDAEGLLTRAKDGDNNWRKQETEMQKKNLLTSGTWGKFVQLIHPQPYTQSFSIEGSQAQAERTKETPEEKRIRKQTEEEQKAQIEMKKQEEKAAKRRRAGH